MESIARHIDDGAPACITLLERVAGGNYTQLRSALEQLAVSQRGRLNRLAEQILHEAREIALIDAYRHAA